MKYILSKTINNYDNLEKEPITLYYAGVNIINGNGVNTVTTPNRKEAFKYDSEESANKALQEMRNMSTFRRGFGYNVEKY